MTYRLQNRLHQGYLQPKIRETRAWLAKCSGHSVDSLSWIYAISEQHGAENVGFNSKDDYRTYYNYGAIPVLYVIRQVGLKRQEGKLLR